MTISTIEFIFIIIFAITTVIGLYLFIRSMKSQKDSDQPIVEYDKNGIPIIPRHERNIVNNPDLEDSVAGETTITPDREYLHTVVENDNDENIADNEKTPEKFGEDDELYNQIDSYTQDSSYCDTQKPNNDAFSSLVSATDNLLPVIDTVEEPDFINDSPVLDKHLISTEEQEQNSPLNNATDNINITIIPQQYRDLPPVTVRGDQLLGLVDKYGLKYGAMNMFHRYEHKNGTGILWFSMMGITEEGITPFDLNTMPNTAYHGVVLFLSLPHPKALQGFDTMISTATLMARELNAHLLDESNELLTADEKVRLRNQIQANYT